MGKKTNVTEVMEKLSAHAENFPNIGKQKVVFTAWCKHLSSSTKNIHAFDATDSVTIVNN